MALGQQHVGFSPDGKLFALINDQGILRIWDTESNELKQEFTPNLHLAGPCTALTWITAGSAANAGNQEKKSKKSRKSLGNANETLYIALGTSQGQVSLYSYAQGKIERNLKGEGHNGRVTAIARDNSGQLYTCGDDCQAIVWSLPEEKQLAAWSIGPDKPQSIAYMAHSNNLVVGARQIKVYSLATQELLQTFTGHTSEVNLMTSFAVVDAETDAALEYAVTTSRMERIICLWKIGKKGRNKSAACTLLMEDIAHCLTCQLDNEGNLRVASVTRSGVIHLYMIAVASIKAEKPIKPKVTIEIASDSATVIEPIPAVAASLQHGHRSQEILFGYGDKHFMVFEQLKPNFAEKKQVLVRTDPKKLVCGDAKALFGKKGAAASAAGTAAALKTVTPIINKANVDYKSSMSVVSKKRLKAAEMPMESRLLNLNLNATAVAPQSQSKVQLLVQALHSKDDQLLRSVLQTHDTKTIQLTLQRLPVQYVGTLVNELTLLMQQKRENVEFSINWLKVLAQTHASQLMVLGSEDLLNKFGPCIGIIEHRANCLKELSKLNGRLQLLVSQIKRNTEEEDILSNENVLIYKDSDSSNSDLEDDADEKTASDDEWEEDVEEDGENMEQDDDNDDDDDDMET